MKPGERKPTLRLFDYYFIEGISSFAVTLLLFSVYFWTRERYQFTNVENLAIGAVLGASHIISSRIGGRLGDRWGYNRLLLVGLAGVACVALSAWIPDYRPMPFIAMGLYAAFIGITWPALEAGAMHLPGKLNMPQRLGIYNLVWAISGTTGFFVSGFLFELNPNTIFWIPGALHLFQIAWILFQRNRHDITGFTAMSFPHFGDHTSPEEKSLMVKMSWLTNSLGYFLAGGFAALTPHLGERLGLSQSWTIWLGCSLLAARAVGFTFFWRWDGWHYRRGWGHYALWSAPLYLAVIFFAQDIWLVALSCLLLGVSLSLSYYMSIYYSLDASDNKGEQGGLHESIIGMGILMGPLTGAAGGWLTGTTFGAKSTIIAGAFIIAATGWAVILRSASQKSK
ncbi:MAG TPA: MFS transporter [Kiritimatiellia bacterium]|nr:MFS transporter [Kiritimatiellia bacterium]